MDKNFIDMIKLFAYGSADTDIDVPYDFDFDKVMDYADEQGVWQIVCYAIDKLDKNGKIEIDEIKMTAAKTQMFISSLKNTENLKASHDIISLFDENHIDCCIIKGESVADVYIKPELRISGDIDMLINNRDEVKAKKILADYGYTIMPKPKDSHHYSCHHPVYGELELHTSLYPKIMSEVWFDNIPMIQEEFVSHGNYKSMGYTDCCIYLALHAVKHFLSYGFGVRHIMDFMLYANKYFDSIDFNRFNKIMEQLKYDKFISALIGVGVEHMGLQNPMGFEYSTDEANKLLEEAYNSGIFGQKYEYESIFELYSSLRYAKNENKDTNKYIKKWKWKNILSRISFSKSNMYGQFPYANKNHILLPIAWINYIFYLYKEMVKHKSDLVNAAKYQIPKASDRLTNRIDIINDFDMI